jgi:hypothetical protein
MVIQPGQYQIGSSGRVVAAYPIQPRTLRKEISERYRGQLLRNTEVWSITNILWGMPRKLRMMT